MSDETIFYIVGSVLAASAVVVTFIGLKMENFPGRALPVVILWFAVLAAGAATYSVLQAKEHEEAHAAELHEAGEHIEETEGAPHENEAGALGGETEELEEEAEEEAPGSPEEEPVGPTEGTSGGGAAESTTLQLAADPETIAYDTTELTAKAGKVTIEFDNPSAIPHNVVLQKNGQGFASTPVITESKESVSADLEAGSYTFLCTVPGHAEAGMEGTLSVE